MPAIARVSRGVLVSNEPLTGTGQKLVDIAPTVLKWFGVAIPAATDGKSIF